MTNGAVLRVDFKVYLGLVESPTPKSREIYPGLPVWFAQLLFPDLHRRFH